MDLNERSFVTQPGWQRWGWASARLAFSHGVPGVSTAFKHLRVVERHQSQGYVTKQFRTSNIQRNAQPRYASADLSDPLHGWLFEDNDFLAWFLSKIIRCASVESQIHPTYTSKGREATKNVRISSSISEKVLDNDSVVDDGYQSISKMISIQIERICFTRSWHGIICSQQLHINN